VFIYNLKTLKSSFKYIKYVSVRAHVCMCVCVCVYVCVCVTVSEGFYFGGSRNKVLLLEDNAQREVLLT